MKKVVLAAALILAVCALALAAFKLTNQPEPKSPEMQPQYPSIII